VSTRLFLLVCFYNFSSVFFATSSIPPLPLAGLVDELPLREARLPAQLHVRQEHEEGRDAVSVGTVLLPARTLQDILFIHVYTYTDSTCIVGACEKKEKRNDS
jgi:hypothetical protein